MINFVLFCTTKSISLSGICLAMLLLPTLLSIIVNIYANLNRPRPALNNSLAKVPTADTETITTVKMQFNNIEDNPRLTKEEQWQVIADATMEKAMQGDKAARDWVTKHIFTDPVTPETIDNPFISDAVAALKRAGYKASDVKKVAIELSSQNDYASLEDLIQDIVKNC
jgi:hypothetical protein